MMDKKCTGLIFRATSSNYKGKEISFHRKESLVLLKKESCKCSICDAVKDLLQEYGHDISGMYWYELVGDMEKHGWGVGKYKLILEEMSHDEFSYHFEPIKNSK